MSEETRAVIREEIRSSIEKYVNGKITDLGKRLDDHNVRHEADMLKFEPYMQAASGLGLLFKFFIMVGSISVAYIAIKNGIFDIFNLNVNVEKI